MFENYPNETYFENMCFAKKNDFIYVEREIVIIPSSLILSMY